MRVIFLGTGGTYPCIERNVVAIAVQIGKDVVLFDCGEGTQRQFMRSNVSFMSTRWIFITHYHGDHFLGIPGLIQSMNLNDREKPLDIFGPEGTIKMMKFLANAGYFTPGYEIRAHEIAPGDKIELDGFSVIVSDVDHTVPSLAYALIEDERPGKFDLKKAAELSIPEGPLFRKLQQGESIDISGRTIHPNQVMGPPRKGRKFVYSGDTKPCEAILSLAKDADLLIHDATLLSNEERQAADFGHSTALAAARIAHEAGVKNLALIHYSPRYKDTKPLEDEARSIFPNTIAPSDLDEIIIRTRE